MLRVYGYTKFHVSRYDYQARDCEACFHVGVKESSTKRIYNTKTTSSLIVSRVGSTVDVSEFIIIDGI